jgi:hypothetical protein
VQYSNGNIPVRTSKFSDNRAYKHNHGRTNDGCQVTRLTKFCTVAPNICGSSVCCLLYFTILVPRILRWLLDFCEICAPFIISVILFNNSCRHSSRCKITLPFFLHIHLRELTFRGCLEIKVILMFIMSVMCISSSICSFDVIIYKYIHI